MIKKFKAIKRIVELLLFFFMGFWTRLSFSGKLDVVTNVILFIGAILVIVYIVINRVLEEL